MKKLITTKLERASKYLESCNPESVEYVKQFKDEIDNLTVVESDGYDFVEVDPSNDIDSIESDYIMFGVGEDIIRDIEEFESIYEALCIVEDSE